MHNRQIDETQSSLATALRQGVMGGLIGGIAMAMIMMVVTALDGMGFLKPLYLIAATFHPAWAMQTAFSAGPILIGAMLHMMMSAAFGLVFAVGLALLRRSGMTTALWVGTGMVWGVMVLLVNQNIVLPIVDPAMATATSGLLVWWLLAHLMFGVVLGAIAASIRPASNVLATAPLRSQRMDATR